MVVRILVAGVVGAIVSLILGWLVWGMLLANYFASTLTPAAKTFMSAQPRMMPLIAAQVGFGLFYAFVFVKWAGVRSLASGAVAGAIMGFSIACIMDLMSDAFFINMHIGANTPPMLVDIAAGTIVGALIGTAEGMVLGLMSKGGRRIPGDRGIAVYMRMRPQNWQGAACLGTVLCLLVLSGTGCYRTAIADSDPDAPTTARGRLKISKGLNSLRIGDQYQYRDVTQTLFFDGKPWEPAGDPHLVDRIGWCDTSPNLKLEMLRCFGDSTESYATTYIIRVKNDQPEVKKIDDSGSLWIDGEGQWLLFKHSYYNVVTDETIPVKGMPFTDDPTGSAPIQYVMGVSPDKKTVIGSYDLAVSDTDKDPMVKLFVIDTVAGKSEIRFVSFTKYPWLRDHEDPQDDVLPPPATATKFVWKKDASGRDRLVVPELGPEFKRKVAN